LNLSLKRLNKLNTTFEKIGFATDTYLGYLTVSPRYLGTAMSYKSSINMQSQWYADCEDILREKMLHLQLQTGLRHAVVETETGEMQLQLMSE
jgi:hypothetical protein